jgi:dihydrofolate reductase
MRTTSLSPRTPWYRQRSGSGLDVGDAAEAVARLKDKGRDLLVFGSGELVQSLMQRTLVDDFVLLIHPLVPGMGRRLFPDGGAFVALRLVDAKPTATGVVIATYQPAAQTRQSYRPVS